MLTDELPLWMNFFVALAVSFLFIELGIRLGARKVKITGVLPNEPAAAAIIASALGLLAFLLGFTFNIAVGRFEERRLAVIEEANALGTLYLRADFLEQPTSGDAKGIIRTYVALRAAKPKEVLEIDPQVLRLQSKLWAQARQLAQSKPTPITACYINALNSAIDMYSKRVALGLYGRVPLTAWGALMVVASLAMFGVGYYSSTTGNRSWVETSVLILCFSTVMVLVADMDRPTAGMITTNLKPLEDLALQLSEPN